MGGGTCKGEKTQPCLAGERKEDLLVISWQTLTWLLGKVSGGIPLEVSLYLSSKTLSLFCC